MITRRIPVQMLGQSGCRFGFNGTTVYFDPYLSNSVQILDSPDLERKIPIPIAPEKIIDADFVLITHEHIDHCDPHTLPLLAKASPEARFVGPAPVLAKLRDWGIDTVRLVRADETWFDLAPHVRVKAIPAAHPEIERDEAGNLVAVGYLIDFAEQKIYLAGDTSARQEIIDTLVAEGPIHTTFLPVNEHNFFRSRRGIIGNMSVREAFQFAEEIGVRQVVPMHWDMFASNAVDPDEIHLIYQRTDPGFALQMNPKHLVLGDMQASIIIRTLNEARYLNELLTAISAQETKDLGYEVILVDSGSSDDTLQIAEHHNCRVRHISRQDFSFGRSLNIGCACANGDILVIISGHCVPTDQHWLQQLCQPIIDGNAEYTYGRQYGGAESHFSERRLFAKYYPECSCIPQEGFFCNNANAALLKTTWEQYRFDEELTGLEDMELAQRLIKDGGKVAYVAEAGVWHNHCETWPQVRRRFEREAIALQKIMPQVHVQFVDTLRYSASSIWKDWRSARKENAEASLLAIIRYRWNQYKGIWKGNSKHRKLSHAEKEKYFYPD